MLECGWFSDLSPFGLEYFSSYFLYETFYTFYWFIYFLKNSYIAFKKGFSRRNPKVDGSIRDGVENFIIVSKFFWFKLPDVRWKRRKKVPVFDRVLGGWFVAVSNTFSRFQFFDGCRYQKQVGFVNSGFSIYKN